MQNSPAWPKIVLLHPFLLLEFARFLGFLAEVSESVISHSLYLSCADTAADSWGPFGRDL